MRGLEQKFSGEGAGGPVKRAGSPSSQESMPTSDISQRFNHAEGDVGVSPAGTFAHRDDLVRDGSPRPRDAAPRPGHRRPPSATGPLVLRPGCCPAVRGPARRQEGQPPRPQFTTDPLRGGRDAGPEEYDVAQTSVTEDLWPGRLAHEVLRKLRLAPQVPRGPRTAGPAPAPAPPRARDPRRFPSLPPSRAPKLPAHSPAGGSTRGPRHHLLGSLHRHHGRVGPERAGAAGCRGRDVLLRGPGSAL